MSPLVSILIPAYNAERWIAETIQSALVQTWPYKEIIVVDDGSTDKTLRMAREFRADGVTVVTQKNRGASGARNKALALSQGDYIQWLDADDLLSPDKIAKQMENQKRYGSKRTLFSSAWAYFFYRPGKAKFIPSPLWCDLSPVEFLLTKMSQNVHMQPGIWLVSRELTEAAGPWDTRLRRDNDGEYFCRVIAASDGIRFVPGARTFYRRASSDSVTNIGRSNKKLDSQFLSMQLHVGYLLSLENSERTRAACVSYLQTWLPNFYPQRPEIVQELTQLAASLGGELLPPRLSWKYAWIQKILGWKLAKEAQLVARKDKENILRSWDRALLKLDRRRQRR